MWANLALLYFTLRLFWSARYELLTLALSTLYLASLRREDGVARIMRAAGSLLARAIGGVVHSAELREISEILTDSCKRFFSYITRLTFEPPAPRSPPLVQIPRRVTVDAKATRFQFRYAAWNTVFPNLDYEASRVIPRILDAKRYDEFYKFLEAAETPARLNEFLCPISKEIMSLPVIASDGSCYDAASIFSWVCRKRGRNLSTVPSPLTGVEIEAATFFPNNLLRGAILDRLEEFQRKYPPQRATSGRAYYANLFSGLFTRESRSL